MSSRNPGASRIQIVLVVVLLVLVFPRFDRHDLFVGEITSSGIESSQILGDAEHYIGAVRFYRGDHPARELIRPFANRPLVPFLAGFLPFDPLTSLNIINATALVGAVLLLFRALLRVSRNLRGSMVAAVLFTVSFPVFYYGTIGYVDPVALFFVTLIFYSSVFKWRALGIVAFFLGGLTKETILVAIPPYLVASGLSRRTFRSLLVRSMHALPAIVAVLISHSLFRDSASHSIPPSLDILFANLLRPRAWVSVVLTIGPLGIALLWLAAYPSCRKRLRRNPVSPSALIGVVTVVLLVFFGIFATFVDGRLVWYAYPYLAALVAIMYPVHPRKESPGERISATSQVLERRDEFC